MRKSFLSLTIIVALSACAPYDGYPSSNGYGSASCGSNVGNTMVGAGVGVLGGGVIGNILSGRHNRGRDTALGAVSGGLLGGLVGASQQTPCPQPQQMPMSYGPAPGYYEPPPSPPVVVQQHTYYTTTPMQQQPYYAPPGAGYGYGSNY